MLLWKDMIIDLTFDSRLKSDSMDRIKNADLSEKSGQLWLYKKIIIYYNDVTEQRPLLNNKGTLKQTGKSASKKVERNMKQIEDGYRR